MSKFPRRK